MTGRHRAEDAPADHPAPGPREVGLSFRLLALTLAVGAIASVVLSVLAYYRS